MSVTYLDFNAAPAATSFELVEWGVPEADGPELGDIGVDELRDGDPGYEAALWQFRQLIGSAA